MSRSIKISTIDQAEDYINRQGNQLRNIQSQMNNVADEAKQAAKREAEKRVNALRKEMEKIEDNFNFQIEGLEGDMKEMDRSHRQAMRRQSDEFYRNLTELKDWTSKSIDDLESKVDESFEKQQQQINEQKERINRLYKKDADENEKARLMLKDLRILVSAIGERCNHYKFAEGKWNQLSRRVENLSKANVPSVSVISEAMNITNDLWDLEEDVLKAQLKFEVIHNLVLNEATELLKIMGKNRTDVYYTDDDGKRLKDEKGNDIKVEIDFWTKDDYKKLEEKATDLKTELETKKGHPNLTEERLKDIRHDLNDIKAEQTNLVELALQRGIASEERVKISEEIINALEEQGFTLNTMQNGDPAHNYLKGEMEGDQREGVFAVLKNGVGTEISIIIHPDETLTKNHIVFQRNDESNLTPDELRRSIEGVRKIIESKGYKMGSVGSPQGTGDSKQAELVDANALAKAGINKELKERLGFTKKQVTRKQ
ncbi:MAG: hypothetical protein JWQ09_3140 [Segetibacter sp.]|nr:hypothetical protein [Segetibacter sp.]